MNDLATDMDPTQRGAERSHGCDVYVRAWCLPPGSAARRARSLLRACLRRHLTDEELSDDLEAVVDELAANAWQHACGPCEMRVVWHQGVPVLCEITDGGDAASELTKRLHQADDLTADTTDTDIGALLEGGRGLAIVARLTNGHCGARQARLLSTGQPGTSVWFAIPAVRPGSGHNPAAPGGIMNPPGELTAEDVALEFPDWDISKGSCGLWYAHLRESQPPLMTRGEDPTDLRDEIRRRLAQAERAQRLAAHYRDGRRD
jgi:anti-sigma regulatory factor (Ser/Thr protein kinase)